MDRKFTTRLTSFFLTKRSLYVLVADTRKEDTDFYYWLNIVELLSDNSPLLIIKNEKQDRKRQINEKQLRGQFGNLKEVFATNLATGRGLHEVLSSIKYFISNLPHIGTSLPKTWLKVRELLEKDARNYISLEEYMEICELNGFTQLKDKLQLSEYLHDLGVCLHFQDDPLLKKTVILKPKWGTDAVYRVLDNENVINNFGRFSSSDLALIWNNNSYAEMRDELLQLMLKFKLCYKIKNSDIYIAPQLLNNNQPHYAFDENEKLVLRYAYEFMPKGILTQFIVATHNFIAKKSLKNLVWRSGVVLEKNHTYAEVIEHYDKREIWINIYGQYKKELMTIITYELDNIHSSYKRLLCNKLIPCNCTKCKNSHEPYFYKYESLQRRIRDKQQQVECDVSYQMVNVNRLIDDVLGRTDFGSKFPKGNSPDQFHTINALDGSTVIVSHSRSIEFSKEENKVQQDKVINVGAMSQVSAPIVISDTIKGSFNALAHSEIDPKIKLLLEQLLGAISEVNKNISKDKTEDASTMARDAETLVKEVTSKKPRKALYKMSIDELKKGANNVGEIAKPVLDVLHKLTKLLSP